MIRELPVDPRNLDAVGEALHGLRDSEVPVVLRGGASALDRHQWYALVSGRFGLISDRRHFSAGSKDLADPEGQPEIVLSDWWEIAYEPALAHAYTYSKTRQPLHTDNSWFADPAEINFFIMEKQAPKGGEQLIYPVSRLMDDLSKDEPGLLQEITGTVVTIKKGEHDYFNRTPIIALDNGPRIYWNFYRTEKPTPEVARMCDALFAYLERRESTPSVERVRLESGDCLAFNDLKMLHGRTAFEASLPRDRVFLQSMWKLPPADALDAGRRPDSPQRRRSLISTFASVSPISPSPPTSVLKWKSSNM
jgi:alpha-ketoglutarate-dependent taurine dioxygenase